MAAHPRTPLAALPRRLLSTALVACVTTWPAAAQVASSGAPSAPGVHEGGARARGAAKPFAAWSSSVHALRDSLARLARAQVGIRYRRGGQSPASGFDCSGLVRYVMAAVHQPLPRTAAQQARVGRALERDTSGLRPGDLIFFGRGRRGRVSHIGVYVGSGRVVHASSGRGRVIESDLTRGTSPLVRAWRGVRRVVGEGGPDSTRAGDG